MSKRVALYVRLPEETAERLDRAAFELKASKQDLIAGLVAKYVDPTSPESLRKLTRRVILETPDDGLTVGRAAFRPAAEPAEVLTPAELAAWLQVDEAVVLDMAERGKIPGRQIGDEWRFARASILHWLARD